MAFENEIKLATGALAFLSLAIGGMIYLAYRPMTLLIFDVADFLNLSDCVRHIRQNNTNMPEWMIYSLPDGLWLLAYMLYIGIVYCFKIERSWMMQLVLPLIAISSEILQFFKLLPGTYDICDILSYLIAMLLGFYYIIFINNLMKQKL